VTRDFRDFLDDMLAYARQAVAFVGSAGWDEFRTDAKTQFAVARAIEIVGEAARRIPEDIQVQYPCVPWRKIVGMRNILAHNYDGADPRIIFDTATLFLPDLIVDIAAVIDAVSRPEASP
jgi:uncharacterized protein with HEPN domain